MVETLESRFAPGVVRLFGSIDRVPATASPALWPYILHLPPGEPFVVPQDATSPAVIPYVNHGRWLGDCPFCASAQHVSTSDPRFFCARCANSGNGCQTVPVAWPAAKTVAAVEAILLKRPFAPARNWNPQTETLAFLRAENAERGDA